MMKITIDGSNYEVEVGERLIDVINRVGKELPQVCYHPQLGPIQTCDTCLVEVTGELVRACATVVADGMRIESKSARADAAQREAFDRVLANHMLYCTVCDNNNGNCMIHNTTKMLKVNIKESRSSPSRTKLTPQPLTLHLPGPGHPRGPA
jgi:formate dehydrogenase major subunit